MNIETLKYKIIMAYYNSVLFLVGTKFGLILLIALFAYLFSGFMSGFSISGLIAAIIGAYISVSFFYREINLKWFKYE